MSQIPKSPPNALRPEDYPLGSAESRAAARAEIERRASIEEENAFVMVMTGVPDFFQGQPPVIEPPDTLHRYQVPDGSIVQVIRRHWGEPNRRGVTIYIKQVWPDGETYRGENVVRSLEEVQRLGLLMSESTR
jgi:hypothetical protein